MKISEVVLTPEQVIMAKESAKESMAIGKKILDKYNLSEQDRRLAEGFIGLYVSHFGKALVEVAMASEFHEVAPLAFANALTAVLSSSVQGMMDTFGVEKYLKKGQKQNDA
jgi:hypothetical protein